MSGFSTSGAAAADFTVSDPNSCAEGETLAPQSSCAITVTFTPSATDKRTLSLSVADDLRDSPQALKLKGAGK